MDAPGRGGPACRTSSAMAAGRPDSAAGGGPLRGAASGPTPRAVYEARSAPAAAACPPLGHSPATPLRDGGGRERRAKVRTETSHAPRTGTRSRLGGHRRGAAAPADARDASAPTRSTRGGRGAARGDVARRPPSRRRAGARVRSGPCAWGRWGRGRG